MGHLRIVNPHAALTKGELLKLAMPARSLADEELAAATVSCAKINAGRLPGGDANTQCGLCIACLVRRASFIGAKLNDQTRYLINRLPAKSRETLVHNRRHDIDAWARATTSGIPDHRILGSAVWPPGTDLDAVLDLCSRGLKELKRVPFEMPRLDCHAHIAPDVTPRQIAGLEQALIFAMPRSPAEAAAARRRRADPTLVWGFGAHPALPSALAELNPSLLSRAVNEHVMIGEVGLDRQGHGASQQAAFEMILQACSGAPVLLSIHSTGRTRQVLDLLEQQPHPGAILHWFNGTPDEIQQAVELGCYFSINNAMTDERIYAIPKTRILPETNFPASRKSIRASKPGDIRSLEERLAARGPEIEREIRLSWFANLRSLTEAARVLDRLPRAIQATIVNNA